MTSIDRDFSDLAVMRVPVKRAAYSRRTAWTMAILAEQAYTPFDEESEQYILNLAEELATLTDREKIAERLVKFRKMLGGFDGVPVEAFAKHRLVCGEGRGRQAEVRLVRESCRAGRAGVDAGLGLEPRGDLQLSGTDLPTFADGTVL